MNLNSVAVTINLSARAKPRRLHLAWQFDCSEFGPKWEGDHSKIPVHFGVHRLAMEHLQRVDIEEVLPQVHFQVDQRMETPKLGMIQQVHANMSESGRE